jgi:membrane protein implicated in regulation of membrane protease activity
MNDLIVIKKMLFAVWWKISAIFYAFVARSIIDSDGGVGLAAALFVAAAVISLLLAWRDYNAAQSANSKLPRRIEASRKDLEP